MQHNNYVITRIIQSQELCNYGGYVIFLTFIIR